MQIPLIIEVNPSKLQLGPIILLKEGFWKITSDHVNSKISLITDDMTYVISPKSGVELQLTKQTNIRVQINESGTENRVSIFAKRE